MHKNKAITGACIIAVGLISLSVVLYGRLVLDCYEISDRFDREYEENACDFGWAFYGITTVSVIMLGLGGWLLLFGLKSLSLASMKKS